MLSDNQKKWTGYPATRGQDMGAMHLIRTWFSISQAHTCTILSDSHNNPVRRQVLPPPHSRWGNRNSDWPKTTLPKWEQEQHGGPLVCSPVPHQDSENATWFQPAGCLAYPSQPLHHYISPASPAMMTNDSQRESVLLFLSLCFILC